MLKIFYIKNDKLISEDKSRCLDLKQMIGYKVKLDTIDIIFLTTTVSFSVKNINEINTALYKYFNNKEI